MNNKWTTLCKFMNVLARTDEIARIENLIENKSVLNASIDRFNSD